MCFVTYETSTVDDYLSPCEVSGCVACCVAGEVIAYEVGDAVMSTWISEVYLDGDSSSSDSNTFGVYGPLVSASTCSVHLVALTATALVNDDVVIANWVSVSGVVGPTLKLADVDISLVVAVWASEGDIRALFGTGMVLGTSEEDWDVVCWSVSSML